MQRVLNRSKINLRYDIARYLYLLAGCSLCATATYRWGLELAVEVHCHTLANVRTWGNVTSCVRFHTLTPARRETFLGALPPPELKVMVLFDDLETERSCAWWTTKAGAAESAL